MNWVTILWSMVASAALTLGAIQLMVWFKKRKEWANLFFCLLAVATAVNAANELRMMRAETVEQFAATLRWGHFSILAAIVSLVFFVRHYLRAGRRWLAWTICLMRVSSSLLALLIRDFNYRELTGIRHIHFLGESISIAQGVPNPLMLIGNASLLLLVVFTVDAAVSVWRRGARRSALVVGGSIVFAVLGATVHGLLSVWQIIHSPMVMSPFNIALVLAMGYEITREELRAGQLAVDLRESEAGLQNLFEGTVEGIFRTSPEGKLLFANPAFAKLLGYDSPDDAVASVTHVGLQIWAVPEERSGVLQRLEKEGVVRGYECRFRRKDGTELWVSLSLRPVPGPDGRTAYFYGFVENIDQRKRAEETLKRSERFLAETARLGKVGGWEFDIDTGKQIWTAETYDIHEVDSTYEPTVEKGLAFYTPTSKPIIGQAVKRISEQGEPYDLELEIITAKGHHRDILTIGRADLEHRRIYGFFQDITERKQNEREMAELRLERAHLARVLTVDEISSSLAHEINQPLGAILNNAEAAKILLSQAQGQRGDIPEIIDDIIHDAKRAGDVVRKVRSVMKKGDASFEPLSIHALIDEALTISHSSLVLNDVTLHLELMPDLTYIQGNRVRLQQVLLNLVTNALDVMKDTPSRSLTVRSAMDGPDTVIVSISDSGSGIAESRRTFVFQPFFTTKKDGLGLGLAICRSIIEEHGGRIWADNNPDGGATFSFSLKARREGPA